MVVFTEATSDDHFAMAAQLFKEYASQIGIGLEFQNFEEEVRNLERQYARPQGVIYLIFDLKGAAIGCFGIRKLESTIAELKRMYVKPKFRGRGIGREMLKKSKDIGRQLEYQKMRLDTLSTMHAAIALYETMGFYEIDAYRYNPIPGAKYFEVDLT